MAIKSVDLLLTGGAVLLLVGVCADADWVSPLATIAGAAGLVAGGAWKLCLLPPSKTHLVVVASVVFVATRLLPAVVGGVGWRFADFGTAFEGWRLHRTRCWWNDVHDGFGVPHAAHRSELVPPWVGTLPSYCTKIYLDVGSNKGVQVRKLFEPQLYPGAAVLALFDAEFGPPAARASPSAETGICAVGFEPSPVYKGRLEQIEDAYAEKGWHVRFVSAAAGAEGGGVLQLSLGAWASSVFGVFRGGDQKLDHSTTANVTTVDLARFMGEEVGDRRAKVVMKMDIEGSEFETMEKLFRTGHLCSPVLDVMFVEWHQRNRRDRIFRHDGCASYLKSFAPQCMLRYGARGVPTKMIDLDDESYTEDISGGVIPGDTGPRGAR